MFIHLGRAVDLYGIPLLGPYSDQIFKILSQFYGVIVVIILTYSIGNKAKHSIFVYSIASFFLTAIMVLMLFMIGKMMYALSPTLPSPTTYTIGNFAFEKNGFWNLGFPIISTISMYILISILYREPLHILTSSINYILMLPSYLHIVLSHARKIEIYSE